MNYDEDDNYLTKNSQKIIIKPGQTLNKTINLSRMTGRGQSDKTVTGYNSH